MISGPLKWGICAAGKISSDFSTGLKALPDEEHQIKAVAASSVERAKEFAGKFDIPKAYGSYSDLATDADVNVVYIGSINTQHFEQVKMMLNGGKHVLCEKPMCLTVDDTVKLTELAKKRNLFLMEGVWSRCFPAYKEIQKIIADGEIGEVTAVQAFFGINLTSERVFKKNLGGGAIYDLGIYTLQLAQFIFKDKPSEVIGAGFLNEEGVDNLAGMTLKYPQSKLATLMCSTVSNFPNDASICGTKGFIRIHSPFWCPSKITVNNKDMEFPLPQVPAELFNFTNSVGLTYEAQEVRRCLMSGCIESPIVTHANSVELSTIVTKLRKDLGYQLEQD